MLKDNPKEGLYCPIDIIQIGRQPILDRSQQTYGYELLYRYKNAGPCEGDDDDLVTARTLLYTFLEFGVNHLVGPHRAFVNFTRILLTDRQPLTIDKSRFVLEVLEDIDIDDDLINGVRKLHEDGYTIALDDYKFEPHWEPLLPYCSIIKVDVLGLDLESVGDKIAALKKMDVLLLAEKVETHAEFEMALGLGFDLFQGYFFAKPQVLSTRILQSNHNLMLKMISRINDPNVDLEELAKLIALDPMLSYKILRFINSAFMGLSKRIDSIQRAVQYVGLMRLRSWASLFIMSDIKFKSPEILKTGLIRAELCFAFSKEIAIGEPDSAYTVGLLSILDGLIDKPIENLREEISLPSDMMDALIGNTGPYSLGLSCAQALEQGRSLEAFSGYVTGEKLSNLYIRAIKNAEQILVELF